MYSTYSNSELFSAYATKKALLASALEIGNKLVAHSVRVQLAEIKLQMERRTGGKEKLIYS